jgi:uncharacterized protein YndB with AHSA1/START domain
MKEFSMSGIIILAAHVPGSPADVFEILSTTEGQKGFWTSDCDVQSTAATFRFPGAPMALEVTVANEVNQLVRMRVKEGFPGWVGSTWQWSLSPVEGDDPQTDVQFRHFGFEDDHSDDALGHTAQSWAMILHHLQKFALSKTPDPFFKGDDSTQP